MFPQSIEKISNFSPMTDWRNSRFLTDIHWQNLRFATISPPLANLLTVWFFHEICHFFLLPICDFSLSAIEEIHDFFWECLSEFVIFSMSHWENLQVTKSREKVANFVNQSWRKTPRLIDKIWNFLLWFCYSQSDEIGSESWFFHAWSTKFLICLHLINEIPIFPCPIDEICNFSAPNRWISWFSCV